MNRGLRSGLLFSLITAGSWAQSVWLPIQGQFVGTPGFSYSTFDKFWVGRDRVSPLEDADESLDQYTGFVALEYGILPNLSADATVGYTATSETDTFGDSDDGLADTLLGLLYRVIQEGSVRPAVAIRVGGIIAGTYDEDKPFSAGDGAHGLEASLLLGKTIGDTGFGAYGDIGYRFREGNVPEDLFGSVGVFKQFGEVFTPSDAITVSFGYRHVQGLSGQDIGVVPFPQVKEIVQLIEGSIGYTDRGQRQYQFTVANSVDGRNTGDKLIFLFSVSLPFGGQ